MFDDDHRYFIQFMLKNNCIPRTVALNVHKKITEQTENNESKTFGQFISEINSVICEQELNIITTICDLTGEDNVVLINTSNDNVTKLLGIFTPMELLYFQNIIKEVVTNTENKIPETIAFNLSENLGLKGDDAEEVLEKWIKIGYFTRLRESIYLGCRSIVELTPYLHEYFEEYLKYCKLCSALVFSGYKCSCCQKHFHRICLDKLLAKNNICPHCKKKWNYHPIDETSNSSKKQKKS